MVKYGIASIAPLNRWCRDYRTGGEEALENAYLRAKVAYLKKLRSLRANKSCGASEAPSSDCSQGKDTGSTTC